MYIYRCFIMLYFDSKLIYKSFLVKFNGGYGRRIASLLPEICLPELSDRLDRLRRRKYVLRRR